MIVYVSIGNSDDKLTQSEWAQFVSRTTSLVEGAALIHGRWLSEPSSAYQNACWCIDVHDEPNGVEWLRGALARLAADFRQDSIAWAEAPVTEFLGAPW